MAEANADIDDQCMKQAYYVRLHLLITDLGSSVLRMRFDKSFPPETLVEDLNKNSVKIKIIEPLKKHISRAHYEKMYPPKGKPLPSSKTFDVSLLVFLLRHVCGLNSRAKCWDPKTHPGDTDDSDEADIARIRNIRNEIVHETNPALEYDDFKRHWANVELVLLRLASHLHDHDDVKENIDKLAESNPDALKAELNSLKSRLDVVSSELKSLKSKAPMYIQVYSNWEDGGLDAHDFDDYGDDDYGYDETEADDYYDDCDNFDGVNDVSPPDNHDWDGVDDVSPPDNHDWDGVDDVSPLDNHDRDDVDDFDPSDNYGLDDNDMYGDQADDY